jgi:hypothetical protein
MVTVWFTEGRNAFANENGRWYHASVNDHVERLDRPRLSRDQPSVLVGVENQPINRFVHSFRVVSNRFCDGVNLRIDVSSD